MFKKVCAFVGSLGAAGAVLAADGDITIGLDASALTSLKDAIVSWGSSFLPILLPIVGAFLGFFLLKWAIGVIKKVMSSTK